MDAQGEVRKFVSEGKDLYHRLRSDGEGLSDVDLVAFRELLHILDLEAGRLQDLKDIQSDGLPLVFDGNPYARKPLSRRVA